MFKLFIPLIVINLLLSGQNIVYGQNEIKSDHEPILVEIVKIRRIKNFFIIYAKDKERNYQIISKKVKHSKSCNKISKGDSYKLLLDPYFEKDDYTRFYITHVKVEEVLIPINEDYGKNIFLTDNLSGLCYLPPQL
jgi:hypothetical protein